MKKIFAFIILLFAFIVVNEVEVKAYSETCDNEIDSISGTYGFCGNKNIYILDSNREISSHIVATRGVRNKDGIILYAGKRDGIDTFYSNGFNFYNVVYDDKGLLTYNNNAWSDIVINGVVVFSGEFKDNAVVNESKKGFGLFYNEVGTYMIRQYIGGKVVSAIKVIVANKNDVDIIVEKAMFGESLLEDINLKYNKDNLIFKINGGTYGFGKTINVVVNECKFDVVFNKNLIINNELFDSCLKHNDSNSIYLTIYNGLGRKSEFKYLFKLHSESVSIKLEDSISDAIATSKRILIKASAGMNSSLDEEYCLYYWSKNPNDGLTYEEFMINYEMSENKGEYSSNKGVILRNKEGTYYLYALAKDENSSLVVRSDKYELEKSGRVNKVLLRDFILVGVLCLCAAIPIFVYIAIRGKDTN